MDFITKLARTVPTESDLGTYGDNNSIITFVGAVTKRAHWAVTKGAERFAKSSSIPIFGYMVCWKPSYRTEIRALQATSGNASRLYGKRGRGCRPHSTRKRMGKQRRLTPPWNAISGCSRQATSATGIGYWYSPGSHTMHTSTKQRICHHSKQTLAKIHECH